MTLFRIFICDPQPETSQFDFQVWSHLGWKGTAIPGGRRLGEWAWVGRLP